MDYSFENVKSLFDEFSLKQVNGKWLAINRKNNISYEAEHLVSGVQFAHTWVKATEYNRSRNTNDPKIVTEDDYNHAFNEMTKVVYDEIMTQSRQLLSIRPTLLLQPELLKKEVEAAIPGYIRAGSIIEGLYQEERFAKSFINWVMLTAEIPEYPGSQYQNGMHK